MPCSASTTGPPAWSPPLAGVLTVLLTYFWGRRVAGERAGLFGALVLCLSAGSFTWSGC